MEGRLFTFFGAINVSEEMHHTLIYTAHFTLIVVGMLILAKIATRSMSITPRGTQNVMEAYVQGVMTMTTDVIGKDTGAKYFPLIATIGLFVGFANVIGIIPGFESPSGSLDFTLALALVVFFYYNFEGIRKNGVLAYFKHFMGPVPILAPLMFPIEVVSHIARIVSLSFRLFGNIKGDDLFLMVLLMLAPWFAPVPSFMLLTFMALLQAFIFMMLTAVYISSAIHISEH